MRPRYFCRHAPTEKQESHFHQALPQQIWWPSDTSELDERWVALFQRTFQNLPEPQEPQGQDWYRKSLWNISLDISPVKYINKDSGKVWLSNEEVNIAQSKRLYYTLCIILYLLQSVNPNHHFREQFRLLLQKYPVVDVRYMGFPEDWQEHPLWKI